MFARRFRYRQWFSCGLNVFTINIAFLSFVMKINNRWAFERPYLWEITIGQYQVLIEGILHRVKIEVAIQKCSSGKLCVKFRKISENTYDKALYSKVVTCNAATSLN